MRAYATNEADQTRRKNKVMIKRSIAAALLLPLMASAAAARDIATSGDWKAVVANDGNACWMQSKIINERTVSVVFRRGDSHLFVELSKWSWRFPSGGARVNASLDFDGVWLRVIGTGYSSTGTNGAPSNRVRVDLAQGYTNEFLKILSQSTQFTVSFPEGNELPWNVSTAGNRDAARAFAQCVIDLGGLATVTQPQAPTTPTSPLPQPGSPTSSVPTIPIPAAPPGNNI
jgi:hypothetical protein